MTAALALIIGVTTLAAFVIGFVALLARASGADATIVRLRGELSDEREARQSEQRDFSAYKTRASEELAAARADAADAKAESSSCREEVSVLTERLTQRAQVDKLAEAIVGYRNAIETKLTSLHSDLSANNQLLGKIVDLLEPTRAQLDEGKT